MHANDTCSSLSMHLVRRALIVGAAVLLSFAGGGNALAGPMFKASLDGVQEVPTNASTATGFASFTFNDALTELSYELSVFGLLDITMAHIHLAPAGSNGPVVLWLYPDAPPALLIPGETNGVLASGLVTGADLVGPLLGGSLSDLLTQMTVGNAYVNIHTVQFPGGEIRGQIERIPEPATLLVVAAGLLALVVVGRRWEL